MSADPLPPLSQFPIRICKQYLLISGNNGLYYVMQVISKLLDPKTSEHTASFVGRLVSIVITKVGNQLGENLDLMLRLVLSKMQQVETLSVMEVCMDICLYIQITLNAVRDLSCVN